MKVLITGGAGFIGSNLALALIAKGHEVVVLDNLSEQIHGADPEQDSPLFGSIRGKVQFYKGDVSNAADWHRVLPGVNCIVHLAAETGTGQSMYEVERYSRVNEMGTAVMLEMLVKQPHEVSKVIIASSRAIYGEGKYFSEKYGVVYPGARQAKDMEQGDFEVKYKDETIPLKLLATDEDSKIHPSSVYGITKQNQEQLVLCVCESLGIDAVAFRYQNVYGPGQSLSNPYTGILSIFSTLIQNDQQINIFEDGRESRDFVFIDDVVKATEMAITSGIKGTHVFNVGTGIPVSVADIAALLVKAYDREVPVQITGNFRIGDIRHNYASLERIEKELGFTPCVTIENGITKFASWVKQQRTVASKINESLSEMKAKGLFK